MKLPSWTPAVAVCIAAIIVGAFAVSGQMQPVKSQPIDQQQRKPMQAQSAVVIPRLIECTYHGTLGTDFKGTTLFVFAAEIENQSSKAIDETYLYIRAKTPGRTVPNAETVEKVSIPGGVEPRERKVIRVAIPTSRLGVDGTVFQPSDPVQVAVVAGYPMQKAYAEFAQSKFITAEYRKVQDPNLTFLLE